MHSMLRALVCLGLWGGTLLPTPPADASDSLPPPAALPREEGAAPAPLPTQRPPKLGLDPLRVGGGVEIYLASEDQAQTLPLYLQPGSQPLTGATLHATLADPLGRSVGRLELLDAEDRPLGSFDLLPQEGLRTLRLKLSGLSLHGRFQGTLVLEHAGILVPLAPLVVRHPASDRLQLQEAQDGAVSFRVPSATVEKRLQLIVDPALVGVPVHAVLSELTTPVGDRAALGLASSVLEPGPGGSAELLLVGELRTLGTYSGMLTLTSALHTERFRLSLTRERLPAGLEILVQADDPVVRLLPPLVSSSARVRMHVRETAGNAVTLEPPRLTRLTRDGPSSTRLGAEFGALHVRRASESSGADASSSPVAAARIDLPAGGAEALELEIDGLTSAGRYEGSLEIGLGDGAVYTQTVSFAVRHWWGWCALFLGLGAWAAYIMRGWLERGRAQMVERFRLERLVQDCSQKFEADEPLRQRLLGALERLRGDVDVSPDLDLKASLEVLQRAADAGLSLARLFASGRELPDWLGPGADLEREQAALRGLRRELAGSSLEDLSGEPGRVLVSRGLDLEAGFRRAIAHRLRERLTALQQSLELARAAQRRQEAGRESLEDSARLEAEQHLETRLASLCKLLDEGPHGWLMLEELREAVEACEVQHRHLLQSRLDDWLSRLGELPPGFDDDAWTGLRARLGQESGQDLEADMRLLGTALLGALEKESSRARLPELAQEARALLQSVAQQPTQALTAYMDLVERFHARTREAGAMSAAPEQKPPKAGRRSSGTTPLLQSLGIEKSKRVRHPPPMSGSELVVQKIKSRDRLVLGIAMGVAIILGLKGLYVDDADFGSFTDYINAFLWGFGLHEANRVALTAAERRFPIYLPSSTSSGNSGANIGGEGVHAESGRRG